MRQAVPGLYGLVTHASLPAGRRGPGSPLQSTRVRGMLFFFDYADPLSWTVELLAGRLRALSGNGESAVGLERFPFGVDDLARGWEDRVTLTTSVLREIDVPWMPPEAPVRSQKAFELAFHGAESGCFEAVHTAIFQAHFAEGRDIGRIDALVSVAGLVGLDRSETKAVLDVDRHADAVGAWRDRALGLGVKATPTLVADGQWFERSAAVEELRRRCN